MKILTDEEAKEVLYLAILSQAMIETIENNFHGYRAEQKEIAEKFLEENLRIMSNELGSARAAAELDTLTKWLRSMYDIVIKADKFPNNKRSHFENEMYNLFKKYKLQ